MDIPLIDISGFASDSPGERSRVVGQWREALDRLGFVTISGHGVPEPLVEAVYSAGSAFFDQPEERKLASTFRPGGPGSKGSGYVRLFGQAVGKTRSGPAAPDFAESLTFLASGTSAAGNIWPDHPAGFADLVGRYIASVSDLARRLMRISALALGLPEAWFEPFYAPMTGRLRFAYYPEQGVEPEPGQLRNAAHTDFGCLTILRQDDAPGGLQVLDPSGAWTEVPPRPGTFVINTGDLMQRWTNDRWTSNLHRVVNPPRRPGASSKRLSLVFFTSPRLDSLISCLPTCRPPEGPPLYEPFVAADLMALRIAQTYG